eukprot:PhF_6_TR7186/c0_g1_i1/m.10738
MPHHHKQHKPNYQPLTPFHTVHRSKAPFWSLKDYPYLERGFIQSHYPAWQCIYSFFIPTNETTNVYTQVFGLFVFVYCFLKCWWDDDETSEMWWLRLNLFFDILVCLASTVCHLLQSKSEFLHDVLSVGDWGSILVVGLASGGALDMTSASPPWWPGVFHFTVSMTLCLCFCLYLAIRPTTHTVRLVGMVSCVGFTAAPPIIVEVFSSFELLKSGLVGVACFGVGGIFFASHVPERWFPRTFDICCQSHTLWHICYEFGLYYLHSLLALILVKRIPWA